MGSLGLGDEEGTEFEGLGCAECCAEHMICTPHLVLTVGFSIRVPTGQ